MSGNCSGQEFEANVDGHDAMRGEPDVSLAKA